MKYLRIFWLILCCIGMLKWNITVTFCRKKTLANIGNKELEKEMHLSLLSSNRLVLCISFSESVESAMYNTYL